MGLKKIIALPVLCLLLARLGWTQDAGSAQLWADFNYAHFISSPFSVGGSAGIRTDLSDSDWNKAFFFPRARYRVDKTFGFEVYFGLFQVWNDVGTNSLELRPAQAILAEWPRFENVVFKNRVRLEERYFNYQANTSEGVSPEDGWSYRVRYRLVAQSKYINLSEKVKNFYGMAFFEYFIPPGSAATEKISNRNRLGLGFGQLLSKGQHYEVNLFWQRSRDETNQKFKTDQYVIRLRYYLKTLGQF